MTAAVTAAFVVLLVVLCLGMARVRANLETRRDRESVEAHQAHLKALRSRRPHR